MDCLSPSLGYTGQESTGVPSSGNGSDFPGQWEREERAPEFRSPVLSRISQLCKREKAYLSPQERGFYIPGNSLRPLASGLPSLSFSVLTCALAMVIPISQGC